MRYPNKKRAAIVGAGPVGCLAAEILASRGFHVDLYDKRVALEQAASGRSITPQPNTRRMI